MIYYNQSPPWGQFNRFINAQCLERIAAFVETEAKERILSWGMKNITEQNATDTALGAMRLDSTRGLSVSGDTLYFCCTFDCWFPVGDEDAEEADAVPLDVTGKILFYPPGSKKYGNYSVVERYLTI